MFITPHTRSPRQLTIKQSRKKYKHLLLSQAHVSHTIRALCGLTPLKFNCHQTRWLIIIIFSHLSHWFIIYIYHIYRNDTHTHTYVRRPKERDSLLITPKKQPNVSVHKHGCYRRRWLSHLPRFAVQSHCLCAYFIVFYERNLLLSSTDVNVCSISGVAVETNAMSMARMHIQIHNIDIVVSIPLYFRHISGSL